MRSDNDLRESLPIRGVVPTHKATAKSMPIRDSGLSLAKSRKVGRKLIWVLVASLLLGLVVGCGENDGASARKAFESHENWGEVKDGLRCRITPLKKIYYYNTSQKLILDFQIELQNVSEEPCVLYLNPSSPSFWSAPPPSCGVPFHVGRYDKGKWRPLRGTFSSPWPEGYTNLKPSEIVSAIISYSQEKYVLDPGKYKVSAKSRSLILSDNNPKEIVSNIVEIEIKDKRTKSEE